MNRPRNIKLGDILAYRTRYGHGMTRTGKVDKMYLTARKRSMVGDSVQEVPWDLVEENRVLFAFECDPGRFSQWCYSEQVDGFAEDVLIESHKVLESLIMGMEG